jgi:hypothetical protein
MPEASIAVISSSGQGIAAMVLSVGTTATPGELSAGSDEDPKGSSGTGSGRSPGTAAGRSLAVLRYPVWSSASGASASRGRPAAGLSSGASEKRGSGKKTWPKGKDTSGGMSNFNRTSSHSPCRTAGRRHHACRIRAAAAKTQAIEALLATAAARVFMRSL